MTKDNSRKRIISMLLALVLLATNFPVVSSADGFHISQNGTLTSGLEITKHSKVSVTAENIPQGFQYQWQILIPGTDTWVDIQGKTTKTLDVSFALVGSLLNGNRTAKIRCAAECKDQDTRFTSPLVVSVKKESSKTGAHTINYPSPTTEKTESHTTPATTATTMPEETIPVITEESLPEETVPATTAEPQPEETVPATTAEPQPEETVPATTTEPQPEETVPVTTTEPRPEETVPATTTEPQPEETVPATTAEPQPEETVPVITTEPHPEEMVPATTTEPQPEETTPIQIPKKLTFSSSARSSKSNIVSVTIQYIYWDRLTNSAGHQTWNSYVAYIQDGQGLSVSVPNKTVPGYITELAADTPAGATMITDPDTGMTSVSLELAAVTENMVFTVYYKEVMVPYSARYFLQNTYNDQYTERTNFLTEEQKEAMKGYAGSDPVEADIYPDILGFTSLFHQPDTISADGSTVFEVYYDRNYYLMNFDMNGGYGTAPIYARYETTFKVTQPTRPGYTFNGWELVAVNGKAPTEAQKQGEFPSRIPAENRTYKAKWIQNPTTYTVAYWSINDDGTNTFLGSHKENAQAGQTVAGKDDLGDPYNPGAICGESHTHSASCYANTTYLDFVRADQNKIVAGDGSTVVNVYYEYRKYELIFYYARTTGGTDSDNDGIPDKNFSSIQIVGGSTYSFGASGTNTSNDATLLSSVGGWGSIKEFPTLKRSTGYKKGVLTVGSYAYHYISFEARYGDDISALWPCDVFEPAIRTSVTNQSSGWAGEKAFVSAWNGEHHVKYSQDHKYDNQTIKGLYEHLDESLLFSSSYTDEKSVSYLCFWENGSDAGWNVPELYIYNIWFPCLNNDPEKTPIDDVTGLKKTTKLLKGNYYYLEQSYHTCDDSKISSQTVPSITGYKYLETEWGSLFISKASYNSYTGVYTGKGASDTRITYNANTQILSDSSGWQVKQSMTPVEQTDGTYLLYGSGYDPNNYAADLNHNMYREAYFRDFYYSVNTHTLFFWNHNDFLKGCESVTLAFNTPLAEYGTKATNELIPNDYPTGLEEEVYEFQGWYTTDNFMPGTEMDWSKKMPNADVRVYAKWVPITYNTYFYMDYDRCKAGDSFQSVMDTSHGVRMNTDRLTLVPTHDMNHNYSFIGWFYINEKGEKEAFEPSEMAVYQDLHLYAEWSSRISKKYTVHYVQGDEAGNIIYKDGAPVKLAEDVTGYAFEASTKSLKAKSKEALDLLDNMPESDQNALWLPHTSSHSILMKEDESLNDYTFIYIKKTYAPYIVRYLDASTGNAVKDQVSYPENQSAVVTEQFEYVPGYIPDVFYKTLALSANDDENIITFYYTKDEFATEDENGVITDKNALYYVSHLVHDPDKGTYEEYTSSSPLGEIGTTVTERQLDIPGFEFDAEKTKLIMGDSAVTETNGVFSVHGTVTSGKNNDALELKLYYSRSQFEYTVQYLELGTNRVLISKNNVGLYPGTILGGQAYFENMIDLIAPDIPGYDHYTAAEKTLTISHDESKNIVTFYYTALPVTINYTAVLRDSKATNFGFPSRSSETPAAQSDVAGAQAIPVSGFRFVGWYADALYQQQITDSHWFPSNSNHIVPQISFTDSVFDYHYYALFEPILLTVSQTGMDAETENCVYEIVNASDTVIATIVITGNTSVTIEQVPAGNYRIREANGDWAWNYDDMNVKTFTVSANSPNDITVLKSSNGAVWLTAENSN